MLMALTVAFTLTGERLSSLRVCCKTSQRVKFHFILTIFGTFVYLYNGIVLLVDNFSDAKISTRLVIMGWCSRYVHVVADTGIIFIAFYALEISEGEEASTTTAGARPSNPHDGMMSSMEGGGFIDASCSATQISRPSVEAINGFLGPITGSGSSIVENGASKKGAKIFEPCGLSFNATSNSFGGSTSACSSKPHSSRKAKPKPKPYEIPRAGSEDSSTSVE
ncbi:unnamed protein product [Pylaiella littoralis]